MNIRTATLADSQAIYRLLARAFEEERECFDETQRTQIEGELRDGFTWLVGEGKRTARSSAAYAFTKIIRRFRIRGRQAGSGRWQSIPCAGEADSEQLS